MHISKGDIISRFEVSFEKLELLIKNGHREAKDIRVTTFIDNVLATRIDTPHWHKLKKSYVFDLGSGETQQKRNVVRFIFSEGGA